MKTEFRSCNCEDRPCCGCDNGVFEVEDDFENFEDGDQESEEDQEFEPCEPDNWADGDALASAGFGTDEDYGDFGGGDEW
jgi:hypothetical protein